MGVGIDAVKPEKCSSFFRGGSGHPLIIFRKFSVFDKQCAVFTSGPGNAFAEDVVFLKKAWFFAMNDVVSEELDLG